MDDQLSVVINVKNGELTIDRCLMALSRFPDVVLFDNYSTDRTLEIAAKYPNVNIVQHEFLGMGAVRNLAASYAKHDWVLFVDCDEILHPDLVDKLLNADFFPGRVYSILRHNFYANSFINSSAWENDWVIRLYNRRETRYTDAQVHEAVVHEHLAIEQIESGFIYHFPYNEINQLIDKMQLYSSWYAKDRYPNKYPKLWAIPFRALFMFIKCYILKRGFLDGFAGFAISSYNAIGVFSKYMKLYELHQKCTLGLAIQVDTIDSLHNIVRLVNGQKLLPACVYLLADMELIPAIIASQYANNLCIKYEVVTLDDSISYLPQMGHATKIDYIICPEDKDLLLKPGFLKKIRNNLLVNKKLDKIKIIDLR